MLRQSLCSTALTEQGRSTWPAPCDMNGRVCGLPHVTVLRSWWPITRLEHHYMGRAIEAILCATYDNRHNGWRGEYTWTGVIIRVLLFAMTGQVNKRRSLSALKVQGTAYQSRPPRSVVPKNLLHLTQLWECQVPFVVPFDNQGLEGTRKRI